MRFSYVITNSPSLQVTPVHHPAGEPQLLQVPSGGTSREASSPSPERRPGKSSSPSPEAGPLPQRLSLPAQRCGQRSIRLPQPAQPPAPSQLPSQSCSAQAPCSQSTRGRARLPDRGIPAPPWQGRSGDSELPAGEARRARCHPTPHSRGLEGALSRAGGVGGCQGRRTGAFPPKKHEDFASRTASVLQAGPERSQEGVGLWTARL